MILILTANIVLAVIAFTATVGLISWAIRTSGSAQPLASAQVNRLRRSSVARPGGVRRTAMR